MFGSSVRAVGALSADMAGFPSPFGRNDGGGLFDEYDEFVPEHIPDVGPFLEGHDVLADERHVSFHELTEKLFEERGVYDMTFGYNLARLNLDHRHPGAGYRYAEQRDDPTVLRAEFTPTTPFCPQSHTLTVGSFRAWNGLNERHDYDLVRVRVHPMHHESTPVNEQLEELEEKYLETGSVTVVPEKRRDAGSNPMKRSMRAEGPDRGPQAPF
jgi:hypothetical protein